MSTTVDATINFRPQVGVHYRLESYVCGAGCVKPSPFEGWVTFTQIFQQRPNQCRFAVAQMVPVFEREPKGPYLCWDLYADSLTSVARVGLLSPPPPKWQGASPSGLIMKAMALYDRD